MINTKTILFACTALVAVAAPAAASTAEHPFATVAPHAQANAQANADAHARVGGLILAQAAPDEKEKEKKAPPPAAKPAPKPPAPPAAARPPAPPAAQPPAAPRPAAPAARPAAPPPPAAHPPAPPRSAAPPAAKPEVKEAPKPAAKEAPKPAAKEAPKEAPKQPAKEAPKPATPPAAQRAPDQKPAESKRDERRGGAERKGPDGADRKGAAPANRGADDNRNDRKNGSPAAPPPPASAQKPAAPNAAPAPNAQQPTAPGAAPPSSPAARGPQNAAPAPAAAVAPPPPPTKTQSADQFIRKQGEKPSGGLEALRKERHETRQGNVTVITEGNRTITRDGDRNIIRHNEADRFAVGARNVKVDRRGNDTVSIVVRPNGINIVSTTDRDGHLLRRVRRNRDGREIVIIDNSFAGARRGDYFIDVQPPRYTGPRERYILDAGRADRAAVYGIFVAPPIERIEQRYTLDQVRYSEPLRQYMPRVDLDVNFETGSWQLTANQIDNLAGIAAGLNQAIKKNPREVFLIEGHTDRVGTVEDNLSLSDRRAESVAVALTEQFGVPPENLVTQGYGEQYPVVDTDGPSLENRRVSVRRITPLIDQTANR